jgi:6-phosphogluconolactonase (cycloisomerase 2 family)
MKRAAVLSLLVAGVAATGVAAQAAFAHDGRGHDHGKGRHDDKGFVFVQTNEVSGNRIVVYRRGDDGHLSQAGDYATGGNGGVAAPGNESDRLGTQGSLVYDARHSLLLAVNAGSNTVSAFSIHGDSLKLLDVVPSGGDFPASIAVHGDLVYVLNAGGAGIVQGYSIHRHGLRSLRGLARSLGLANSVPPNFLTSPGQVGFTPDGRQLIVTTKASGSNIDVFRVGRHGLLSDTPVVNASATPVPFAFTFDRSQRLVVGEAGTSSVTTYTINHDGTLTGAQSLSDNQTALCWIQQVRGYYYVANTGSNTLSVYRIDGAGKPSLVGPTGVVASTEAGPIDLAAPSKGDFLYGETGTAGTVDEYRVNRDGTLTKLGAVTGLPAGIEGIAAT